MLSGKTYGAPDLGSILKYRGGNDLTAESPLSLVGKGSENEVEAGSKACTV